MTLEQDFIALARLLNAETVREEAAFGMTIEEMRIRMAMMRIQLRHRQGYNYLLSQHTGASGPTGPAS